MFGYMSQLVQAREQQLRQESVAFQARQRRVK